MLIPVVCPCSALWSFSASLAPLARPSATDRLAYLSFSAAQLSGELAKSLDLARAPLKELRDLELDIQRKSAKSVPSVL